MKHSPVEHRFAAALRDADNESAELLLANGDVKPDMKYFGKPVIYIALTNENENGARMLEAAGAKLDIPVGGKPMAIALFEAKPDREATIPSLRMYHALGGTLKVHDWQGLALIEKMKQRGLSEGVNLCISSGESPELAAAEEMPAMKDRLPTFYELKAARAEARGLPIGKRALYYLASDQSLNG